MEFLKRAGVRDRKTIWKMDENDTKKVNVTLLAKKSPLSTLWSKTRQNNPKGANNENLKPFIGF